MPILIFFGVRAALTADGVRLAQAFSEAASKPNYSHYSHCSQL